MLKSGRFPLFSSSKDGILLIFISAITKKTLAWFNSKMAEKRAIFLIIDDRTFIILFITNFLIGGNRAVQFIICTKRDPDFLVVNYFIFAEHIMR